MVLENLRTILAIEVLCAAQAVDLRRLPTGAGLRPALNGNQAYCASKHAIVGMTKQLSFELGPFGITVNAVAPGAMVAASSLLPPDPALERRAIPMGRKGDLEEIAGTVLFLLSDMSTYMTGQCLTVDGGISLKWSHLAEDNTPVLVTNADFLKAMKGE